MNCRICNHEEHEVAKCKQCNCGESELIHPRPGYKQIIPNNRGGSAAVQNTMPMGGRRAWCPDSQ